MLGAAAQNEGIVVAAEQNWGEGGGRLALWLWLIRGRPQGAARYRRREEVGVTWIKMRSASVGPGNCGIVVSSA